MNTMHRERRSHARTFIEVTPELRRALEALVEAGIAALDEIDAPAEDLEDGADDEPSFGWTHLEAMRGRYVAGVDEGEEDDPAEEDDPGEESDAPEDGGDAEPESRDDDADITWPDTSGGMKRPIRQDDEESLRLREAFDPRLALRPEPTPNHEAWCAAEFPRFPWDAPDRREMDLQSEKRRIGRELVRIHWSRPRGER